MRDKYNLEEIWKEIEQDGEVAQGGAHKLTQEEIRKKILAKREAQAVKKGNA